MPDPETLEGIAIIGMSGRFPGARDLDEYWRNLRAGVEAITFFTAAELEAAGIPPEVLAAPDYVRAGGVLTDIDLFDAQFFGFTAREAELLDPHHRLFLEQAWQALESAGYDSASYPGAIAVFGGMGMGEYLLKNLHSNPEVLRAAGGLRLRIYNDKDFLASLTAYKLNLKGPTASVQAACATSLVAASLACQSLVSYQCDMALAGGVCLSVPPRAGYFAHEGVFSPDGHCRAFDARAQGTVSGAGAGVLVLKRLAEAVADGDTLHAVIKGWAVNNDGALKVGYTAPSLDGQAEAIAMAQAVAGVDADTITYVEAHGTGTPLGDQIEIAALSRVFRETTARTGFCAVGSVKASIGHLDAAAGAASLIKTALALEHREIPPSVNFEQPNPAIDFAGSPFYVNAALQPWAVAAGVPRRAGVSAFAVGGVNAHLVLEEAPAPPAPAPGRPWQLLRLSARTEEALEAMSDRLAERLERADRPDLADLAYTLEVGRRGFAHRRALVCRGAEDAVEALRRRDPKRLLAGVPDGHERSVAFLFPGLGNHYVGMARELYQEEAVFRRHLDRCAELLTPALGEDIRAVLYPTPAAPPAAPGGAPDLRSMLGRGAEPEEGAGELIGTRLAQPVLFAVEHALAQLWISWGVEPRALAGYSIGEYVAACLAGVFSLEDALRLVAERARLIDGLPRGAMLAVSLAETAVRPLLGEALSLAAINGPEVCVVAGPAEAVAELQRRLAGNGVTCRRLQTTHAFHSSMMEPIVSRFAGLVRAVPRRSPQIPFVSNVTGTWITPEAAMDPGYWAEHLVRPVRFADALRVLWQEPSRVLLEVGPGQALSSWALQLPREGEAAGERKAFPSLRHAYDPQSDQAFLLTARGRLWLAGAEVPTEGFWAGQGRRRVPLPTYPFERRRYWIEPGRAVPVAVAPAAGEEAPQAVADWFWVPVWKETAPFLGRSGDAALDGPWLIFADREGVGFALAERLEAQGQEVALAVAGERFERVEEGAYTLAPADPEGYRRLLADLDAEGRGPARALHLWNVTREPPAAGEALDLGLHSLVFLAQALGERGRPLDLTVLASRLHAVTGEEEIHPETAALLGACAVIPLEIPGVTCRSLDLLPPAADGRREGELIDRLVAELAAGEEAGSVVAWRGGRRWVREFAPVRLAGSGRGRLRRGGVYLITGGRGGIGLVLARELARSVQAKLVLVGRSPVPAGDEWPHALREIEALGGEVLALAADVTDREALRKVRRLAEERFGAVHGILHAAGVPPGGMIQLKTREALAAVLAPKVAGTRALAEVFAGAELDFLMLFSSLTSILGAFGLVDHAAANAFLDAFAHDAVRRGLPVVAVHWDTWLEVGQAAAAAGYGLAGRAGAAAGGGVHPLLAERTGDEPGEAVYRTLLGTGTHWVLDEHRIAGRGLLPGTAYLEMARAAFADRAGAGPVELRRFAFLEPLIVPEGETREVRTVLARDGEEWDFRVESRAVAAGPWREHARGRARSAAEGRGDRRDLAALAAECRGGEARRPAGDGKRERAIGFGPRWQDLVRGLTAGEGGALAELELPAGFAADLADFQLHPALLDAATGFVQLQGEGSYLPLGYERVVVRRPLPARFFSHARFAGGDGGTLACDLTLLAPDGEVLVEIEGYTLRRIEDPAALAASAASAPAEPFAGIRPEQGAEAFRRLLAAGGLPAEILVSIRPFPALLRRDRSLSRQQLLAEAKRLHAPGAVHERPRLQTAFEPPRTALEERLAGVWRELLGLASVGVHDDFFDLGGDSLLVTRLIGLLEEAFGVQLSLRAVFEAPTVSELAVVIVQAQAADTARTDSEALAAALAEIQQLSPEELQRALAEEG